MLGYCSNSPLRCGQARSMTLLNQVDSCCPECGVFLLPAQNLSRQLRADERFLQYTFLTTGLMLLACVYIYYVNFV
ncbi:DUF2116 domain-containing protein [Psychrobacter okhotskensis]|jgi:hypothetical protein